MARSAVNRWIRDRIEVDSQYPQSAKQYIRQLEKAIEGIHPGHRMEAVAHAREYAVLYYGDRHKHTPVPRNVTARLDRLDQRAEKAERFDRAREFVQKYGPPEKALVTFMRAPEREKAREEKRQEQQIFRSGDRVMVYEPMLNGGIANPEPWRPAVISHDYNDGTMISYARSQSLNGNKSTRMAEAGDMRIPTHQEMEKFRQDFIAIEAKGPTAEERAAHEFNRPAGIHGTVWTNRGELPTKEKLRGHDIPWMMTTGPIHEMSQKHLDQAQRNYDQWPHKDKRSFVEYVNFTREHWSKSPEDRQPAKQQERSREVELSR